jgi:opacity protein-like surface antigen
MKIRIWLFSLALAFAMISPAFAEKSTNYDRSGLYFGAGGLFAIEDFDGTGGLNFKNSPGYNFRLGYRFHPNIAVEAMSERAVGFDLKGLSGAEVNTWTTTLNGKFFALTGQFQPYGLFGIGAMQAQAKVPSASNTNDFGFALRYGAGMDTYITENLVFNLEASYVHPQGKVEDVNYVALGGGIQFRF